MTEQDLPWYKKWFNEDYLKLYSYRSAEEAEQQVNFVIHALKLKGDEKILDLGCGKGRHSLELAKKGYKVLGIDISEYLIDEAKKCLKMVPSKHLRFQIGDMYHLEHLGTFDVVLNMFTSFGYFDDDKDNAKVFQIVRDHLQSGGKFFLDYLHPAQVRKD
nr:hypothetical protein [Chlamydiota bacterium]